MSEPFVAEIRIVGFNFAPVGWAFCDGQILPISQNTALFSLVGTYYGGDGRTNFALPNLQASAPMHQGQGPGLANQPLGISSGTPSVTLITSEMPLHTHTVRAAGTSGAQRSPENNLPSTGRQIYSTPQNLAPMAPNATQVIGGSQPHNNMQPYLTLNFIIALQGIFPSRS